MSRKSLRRGDVVVLTTVARDGFPHHAFLSDDEVSAPHGGRVAVSLLAASRSAGNLEAGGKGALLHSGSGVLVTRVVRRRRSARSLEADPARRLYVLDVVRETVAVPLAGEEGEVATGLAFRRREGPDEARRRAAGAEELAAAVRVAGSGRRRNRGGDR